MPAVEVIMIRKQGETLYQALPLNTPYDGSPVVDVRLAGPSTTLQSVTPYSPPNVQAPYATGDIYVGGTITANSYPATGNPTPVFNKFYYKQNGTLLENENGASFSLTNFLDGDILTLGVIWSSTINGEEVYGSAETNYTISNQPAITADVAALKVGQEATVTFNIAVAADKLSITQDGASLQPVAGTLANSWKFTPKTSSIVVISANEAGYASYNKSLEVQPPDPIHQEQGNISVISHATAPTEFSVSTPDITTDTLDGNYTAPAPSQSGAPAWASGPTLTRDNGDLVLDPGILVAQDAELVSVSWNWPDGSTGLRMPEAGYEGTTVSVPVTAVDSLGREATAEVSIAIPASTLEPGLTDLGFFVGTNTTSATSKNIAIDLGIADPTKLMIVATLWGPEPADGTSKDQTSLKIVKDGLEYPANPKRKAVTTLNSRRMTLWDIPCPVGGAATLVVGGQATTYPGKAYVFAGKNVSFVAGSDTNKLGTSFNATGGTSQVGSDRTTVAGDEAVLFVMANTIDAAGLFTPVAGLTEIHDEPAGATEPQLFVGRQTATGTSTTSRATPSVNCEVAFIHSIYRNNP